MRGFFARWRLENHAIRRIGKGLRGRCECRRCKRDRETLGIEGTIFDSG